MPNAYLGARYLVLICCQLPGIPDESRVNILKKTCRRLVKLLPVDVLMCFLDRVTPQVSTDMIVYTMNHHLLSYSMTHCCPQFVAVHAPRYNDLVTPADNSIMATEAAMNKALNEVQTDKNKKKYLTFMKSSVYKAFQRDIVDAVSIASDGSVALDDDVKRTLQLSYVSEMASQLVASSKSWIFCT